MRGTGAARPEELPATNRAIPGAQRRGTWGNYRGWECLLFTSGTWASPLFIVLHALTRRFQVGKSLFKQIDKALIESILACEG